MEIEITIKDDGTLEIQGYNLPAGLNIGQVARFLTDKLGQVTEQGHKYHVHTTESVSEKVQEGDK